ncbi:MAG TPA: hypothetical protein VHD69_00805, partial [Candidatus Paceibacterota bacterium]|nr:hypothetical protein [Candidatus Paceibacterota bacterium]
MSNQTILDSALAHVRAEDAPAYRPAKKTLRQKIGYWRFKLKSYLVSRSLQRAGVEGWIHVPTERPGMAVLDGGRLSFGRNCTVRSFRSQLTSLCAMGGQIVIGDDCLINSGVVMVAEKGF